MTTKSRGILSTSQGWSASRDSFSQPTSSPDHSFMLVYGLGSFPASPEAVFTTRRWHRVESHLYFGLAIASEIRSWLGTNWQPLCVETNIPNGESGDKTMDGESPTDVPSSRGLLGVFEMVEEMRESYPLNMWDGLPSDLAKNKKHYLYGLPKEED